MIDRRAGRPVALVLATIALLVLSLSTGRASPGAGNKQAQPAKILHEARTVAAAIQEPTERLPALEGILRAQIELDPAGAEDSLKTFPNLPNRPDHFAALALVYARAGNIDETERMYAEIRIEGHSSRRGKLAATDARGYLAIAYATAGKTEEALRVVSQMKDQSRERLPAVIGVAMGKIAEAQAKQGDIAAAAQTAAAIANEDPSVLMSIVGGRVRAGDMPGALRIISELDEGLQRYAQWGIVRAQKEQGRLTAAQLTASAINPGHAKASALLELARYHITAGAKPMAAGLLQEAATAASSTVNEAAKADVLRQIAAAMAEAGETFTAIETAKSIEMDTYRRSAVHDIVKAQARQGEAKGAFNTSLLLKRDDETVRDAHDSYESAVGDVLAELAKSGRAKEARQAVGNFEDLRPRHRLLYARVAEAQADSGDIQGAKATLLLVETEQQRRTRKKELLRLSQLPQEHLSEEDRRRLQDLRDIDNSVRLALEAQAKAQAGKGDLRTAVATADGLTNSSDRFRLIQDIGAIQVQAGRTSQALVWARALPSPSDKAYALLGIAQGLSAPKTKPAAK